MHSRVRSLGKPALVAVLAVLVLSPLIALQWRALDDGADGYRALLDDPDLGRTIWVTVLMTLGSVAIALLLGTALAWAGYSLRGRWNWLAALPTFVIIIPPVAAIAGWGFLLSPRVGYLNKVFRLLPWWSDLDEGPIDVFTVPWIILLTGFSLVSFVYIFVITGLRGIDPNLLTAARVSGSRPMRVFFTIVLPLLRPQLLYAAATVVLLGLGQFTAPLLLGRQSGVQVLTTQMYTSVNVSPIDYGQAAAYGSPIILVGVVLIILQSRVIGNLRRYSSSQGARASQLPGRKLLPILSISVYFFVAVILPVAGLIIVAATPFWSGDIDWARMGLDNVREVLGDPVTRDAIVMTLILSVVSVGLTIPLAYLVAVTLAGTGKGQQLSRRLIDVLSNVPLALPGVIFGAGILFAATAGAFGLYGTPTVLIIAYVIIVLPHMVRVILGQLVSIGPNYAEASRVCGGGPVRTSFRIVIPLVRGGIASGSVLGFALLSHEFAASLMLRTPRMQVMGTVLYDYWSSGLYGGVAVMALAMCLITGVGVMLVWKLGGRDAS